MGGKVPLSRRHNLIIIRLSMSSTWELLCWVRDNSKIRADKQKDIRSKGKGSVGYIHALH